MEVRKLVSVFHIYALGIYSLKKMKKALTGLAQ